MQYSLLVRAPGPRDRASLLAEASGPGCGPGSRFPQESPRGGRSPARRICLGGAGNCNHKGLGLYYFCSALLFGVSGTLCSMILRLELYSSGNRILPPENQNFYNISITLHWFILQAMPAQRSISRRSPLLFWFESRFTYAGQGRGIRTKHCFLSLH